MGLLSHVLVALVWAATHLVAAQSPSDLRDLSHRLPLGVASFHPASAVHTRMDRWRNRTVELFERLYGQRDAFSLDIEADRDSHHSAAVFENIYHATMKKHRASTHQVEDVQEDDYYDDGAQDLQSKHNKPFSFTPCAPRECVAKFNTKTGAVLDLPCSVASAFMPQEPQLPLSFPGNYDMCSTFDFADAHFCTIETGFLVAPLLAPNDRSIAPQPVDFVMIGNIILGKCVADVCDSKALRARFLRNVRQTAAKLFLGARRVRLDFLALESLIEETTLVHCVKEQLENQGDEVESMGTMLFFFLFGILLVVSSFSSFFAYVYPNTRNKYVISFSVFHNAASLTSPMKGEFIFLNGVRVISMLWIIYGHTVLMSSAVSMNLPLANPSALDSETQSFSMTYIRSAEYSVDTFFFMSGLLAANGVIDALLSGRLPRITITNYLSLIYVRFLRLTPVYMFVLFFFTKVFSYCGSGPYWYVNANRQAIEHACRNFFANLFYFNNLYPFGPQGGVMACMGWTWYLANDMQFFLLVPLLSGFFVYQLRLVSHKPNVGRVERLVRLYLPSVSLIIAQIAITVFISEHYQVQGTFDPNFSAYVYVKPWCRISPYIIGCILAMHRFARKTEAKVIDTQGSAYVDGENSNPRRSHQPLPKYWYLKHLAALSGFAIIVFISFIIYDDFKCKADPAYNCHIPGAFMNYGELAPGNWNRAAITAYIALGYPAWGLGLALMANYAADGHGGLVTRTLSHPVFLPLARLSYTVYLVHLICMQWFYARSVTSVYISGARQVLDALGFAALAFFVSFFLYLFVERPFTTLLPWCFGFDKDERRSQMTKSTTVTLRRELSLVSDVDSETVTIATPNRRSSVDLEEPLVRVYNHQEADRRTT